MLMSPVGLRPEKDCTGDVHKQLTSDRVPHVNKHLNCLKIIKERRRKIGHGSQMSA
jgi:hypothetical protein